MFAKCNSRIAVNNSALEQIDVVIASILEALKLVDSD